MKRWHQSDVWFWEEYPFFRLLLPLIAGIVCYDLQGGTSVSLSILISIAAIAIITMMLLATIKKMQPFIRLFSFWIVMIVLFFYGLCFCRITDVKSNASWLGYHLNSEAFAGIIKEQPEEKEKTWKLVVDVEKGITAKQAKPLCGKVFLYLYKDSSAFNLHQGDRILFSNMLHPITNRGNPFEMDYARYAAHNNCYHQQFSPAKNVLVIHHTTASEPPWPVRYNHWCKQQLEKYFQDTATLQLMKAMLLGDEANMDQELRQAYSQTGIIHIISISGSHVAMLFSFISGLLWWLPGRFRWAKYLVALLPVWCYVIMAGSQPSAIRAACMFSFMAATFILQRDRNPINTLLATAFLLLCAQPWWLFSIGFQLSFLAVLSLSVFYKPVYKLVTPGNKFTRLLWQAIAASIAAEILIAPAVVYYFHSFPSMFLIANLLAALCMGILLGAGMLVILLSWLPSIATFIAQWSSQLNKLFNQLILFLQQIGPQSFSLLQLSGLQLLLLYAIITCLGIWGIRKIKAALFTTLSICSLYLFTICIDEWNALHQQFFVVFNTGKSSRIERINGKTYAVLFANDSTQKSDFIIKNAHCGWHADQEHSNSAPIFSLHSRNILLLDEPFISDKKLPIDVLVLLQPLKTYSWNQVIKAFQPKQIIIPSSQPDRFLNPWNDSCSKYHIPLHYTATSGAFVSIN